MCIKKSFLTVICFIILSQNLLSQIVLQGVVTDNGGEWIPDVLVEVLDEVDSTRTFSSYTNQQGQYIIQFLETGVKAFHSQNPGTYMLKQNYPNPFNPSTVIPYELSYSAHITIEVRNILGQKIKTLYDGFHPSGAGHRIWDATDDFGRGVPAGLYIYSMKTDNVTINKKMLLIDGQQGKTLATISKTTGPLVSRKTAVSRQLSDQYTLRITGEEIFTYEQSGIIISNSQTLDWEVNRCVMDIDGNQYKTVKIGNQWWMAENLKTTHYQDGSEIPKKPVSTEGANLTTDIYCVYDNDESNADTYGYLYNWYAVDNVGGIAPAGWHVPTDEDWKELEMFLGMSRSEADQWDQRGIPHGNKLKEAGTTHWVKDSGGTNENGFTALPGGMIGNSSPPFALLGQMAFFWSSTSSGIGAINRELSAYTSDIGRSLYVKNMGFSLSVRCIRN